MRKDFGKWSKQKGNIHNDKQRVFFKEQEIWFCYLGENIGFEQDGKGKDFLRPVIIVKKFNNEVLWIIPITKSKNKKSPYYYDFSFKDGVESSAILSQLRLVDAKRLKYKTGSITSKDFLFIKEKTRQLLA